MANTPTLTKPPLIPLCWQALYRASEKAAEAVRDQLTVAANQPVDFAVRVKGSISVAPRVEASTTIAPKPAHLLAVAFAAVGAQTRNKMVAAIHDAYRNLATDETEPPRDAVLDKIAEELVECAKLKRNKPKNGNVTAMLEVFEITDMLDTYFPSAPK